MSYEEAKRFLKENVAPLALAGVAEAGLLALAALGVYLRKKPARDQREEAHRRIAALIRSSNDSIIGWDLEGQVTSWNAGAELLYGYTAEEALGSRMQDLIPLDRKREDEEIFGKILRGEPRSSSTRPPVSQRTDGA